MSACVVASPRVHFHFIWFFVVAGLLYWFGPPIKDFIERRLGLLFTVFVVLLFGGFVLVRCVL